jgi:DNA-binding winged helix-turn-helix (wHTH) protein
LHSCPSGEWTCASLLENHCLDADRHELACGSELIAIGPKVFDLLLYLVQNRDQVVTRDDLRQAVWRGQIVSESTLTSHVNAVRKAIGDTGKQQRPIRTVARKGLRFVGPVRERFFTPRLRFKNLDELNAWLLDKCTAYAVIRPAIFWTPIPRLRGSILQAE